MKPEFPRFSTASSWDAIPRTPRRRAIAVSALAVLSAGVLAACSSGSSPGTSATSGSSASGAPVTIGASLSLTGDFSTDGQAFEKGYELWAKDVNAKGGILGRPVKLVILNDASATNQVVTNYQTLINSDHVDLTFGPFSSLLTTPASAVAARAGFAFVEGAGGAPTVFNTPQNEADHNVFDVSLPIADEFLPFVNYIASLPAAQRPKTAAYPSAQDPFATPPVQVAQAALQKLGVKTVYSEVFPEEVADYKAPADQVAAVKPDIVVLGSTDVPTVAAFMQAFEQQHYVPKMFIAAAGPDQGGVHRRRRCGQRDRHDGPGRLVPRLRQLREPADGQRVRGAVRRHRVRRQRRRGRGVLGRPGHGRGRHRDGRHRQREDHLLPA